MKIVYICNEINFNSGWGVVNYHTVINSLPFFDEVIVITLKSANNIDLTEYGNLKVFPILGSMTNSKYKLGLVIIDNINIKKNINIGSIDLVHVLVEPLLPLVDIFKDSKKIFSIVGTYSDLAFKVGLNKFLYRKSLKKIDTIVSISEYTANRFNNIYKSCLKVIPLGVDFNSFKRKKYHPARERAFVFVGHIKPRKGLIYALEAFKNIINYDDNIKLYIVSAVTGGPYADICFNYIKENKMSKQVVFLGKVSNDELTKIYNTSICNILTSINDEGHYEGFGLIHLEANACGIPSIGSLDCGNESAIINGKTGFLCRQKAIASIQDSMEIIIKDFDNNNFEAWEKRCTQHAKENNWPYYFKKLKTKVYEI
jgi:glycosyltransferase involved in cell wall biosynthesis